MKRVIEDENYIKFLPTRMHIAKHSQWKERMLSIDDSWINELQTEKFEDVIANYNLTEKDIALLVRFNYFTEEEIEQYNLRSIEQAMPL